MPELGQEFSASPADGPLKSPEFNFTVHSNVRVNEAISRDIEKICTRIKTNISDLVAIILVGGFGRGEGSVLFEGESVRPVNDYDLVAVTRSGKEPPDWGLFRSDLAQEVGITWVDISVVAESHLRSLPRTVYYYDLKHGGRVLYGNPDILESIRGFEPQRIPVKEAEVYLFTRLWCFLGSFSRTRLAPAEREKRFFAANQLSKAALSVAEMRLIVEGKYHHSYAERCRRFAALAEAEPGLRDLVREATEFKLKPTFEVAFEIAERWFLIRHHFLATAKILFEKIYGRGFQDWREYGWWYENSCRTWLRRLYHCRFRGRRNFQRELDINLGQLYLLACFNPGGLEEETFQLAKQRLIRFANGSDLSRWENACDLAAKLRMGND